MLFKPAQASDSKFIYKLRNDPLVKRMSIKNSEHVSWKDHEKWFSKKSKDPACSLWLVEIEAVIVGIVRFERKGPEAEITIHITSENRGKKLASTIIRKATHRYLQLCSDVSRCVAYIKSENLPSIKSFLKAGYCFEKKLKTETVQKAKIEIFKYTYPKLNLA